MADVKIGQKVEIILNHFRTYQGFFTAPILDDNIPVLIRMTNELELTPDSLDAASFTLNCFENTVYDHSSHTLYFMRQFGVDNLHSEIEFQRIRSIKGAAEYNREHMKDNNTVFMWASFKYSNEISGNSFQSKFYFQASISVHLQSHLRAQIDTYLINIWNMGKNSQNLSHMHLNLHMPPFQTKYTAAIKDISFRNSTTSNTRENNIIDWLGLPQSTENEYLSKSEYVNAKRLAFLQAEKNVINYCISNQDKITKLLEQDDNKNSY